jgi:hypothetical protein
VADWAVLLPYCAHFVLAAPERMMLEADVASDYHSHPELVVLGGNLAGRPGLVPATEDQMSFGNQLEVVENIEVDLAVLLCHFLHCEEAGPGRLRFVALTG